MAPLAKPPVCRVMDYGKYRFMQQKRDKDTRKKQKTQSVKEMKMRPKIDVHDYDFKVKAIRNFLQGGHRVKVSIFFRGREMAFQDKGREVLNRVVADCNDLGKIDSYPRMEGRYMRMMLAPVQTAPTSAATGNAKKSEPKVPAPASAPASAPAPAEAAAPDLAEKKEV